jgi:hypothetical protein
MNMNSVLCLGFRKQEDARISDMVIEYEYSNDALIYHYMYLIMDHETSNDLSIREYTSSSRSSRL